MLDREGFRPNVGIILLNQRNQVFWGKRLRTHSWQFPQGGIKYGESPEQAMFRELHEEVGLRVDKRDLVGDRFAHARLLRRDARWGHQAHPTARMLVSPRPVSCWCGATAGACTVESTRASTGWSPPSAA